MRTSQRLNFSADYPTFWSQGFQLRPKRLASWCAVGLLMILPNSLPAAMRQLSEPQWQQVLELEEQRIQAIATAAPSVVAIYGEDRAGGGSGVLIDRQGLALTNHHVIMGAGVRGWAGISDGRLYRWELIGTDPGGDVALIQLLGRDDFPSSPLGDSDQVRVGDWALAMGNPFVLTEDQAPTVTLGVVSGIQRYQPGAGDNQLVYGNCIQVDSSINPGNSGGPLFNLQAEVIGINGRGSFQDRGRVNVGLGYAISANQIKNFLPDLMATKLVEHGSLDANFSNRQGRVICSTINESSPIARAGLKLEDRLLEFEGIALRSANQFTNLICTLPAGWPASLVIETPQGERRHLVVRLLGLPYSRPPLPPEPTDPTPEQREEWERQKAMFDLLRAEPGTIRDQDRNRQWGEWLLSHLGPTNWQAKISDAAQAAADGAPQGGIEVVDQIWRDGKVVGSARSRWWPNQSVWVEWEVEGLRERWVARDGKFWRQRMAPTPTDWELLTRPEAKLSWPLIQALGQDYAARRAGYQAFGAWRLDGSDKAAGEPAARFRWVDDESDLFFTWVTWQSDAPQPAANLVKAAATLNCDGSAGGVIFENWQTHHGWRVAAERHWIQGLEERRLLTWQTQQVNPLAPAPQFDNDWPSPTIKE